MVSRAVVVGVAALAQAQVAGGHRLRVVRATDGTAVAGAEVFDLDRGVDGKTNVHYFRIDDADREMPKVATRLVADEDGFVTAGPGRLHTLLARAPGLHHWIEFTDLDRKESETLELFLDAPLVLELVDERGEPVEGAMVELGAWQMCGVGPHPNQPWRMASDRSGRVFFPHYVSRIADREFSLEEWLELQTPVADPPRLDFGARGGRPSDDFLEAGPRPVRWQLPPLAKVRVEFTGVDALPAERAITFELVGPRQVFGYPDRYASDHGRPVDVLTETNLPLRACFHWSGPDPQHVGEPDLFAYGNGHPIVGGCALLRVPVASDPVAVRVRPVRADGSTFTGDPDPKRARRFDLSLQWFDRQGFRLCSSIGAVAPDATGALHFDWNRPRIDAAERPAKLRVALRKQARLQGWEPLEMPDLVVREVDWPVGEDLDVGTLLVPGTD